jgi:hypothetical protein
MTPSGFEPATFRFLAQYLNHCATTKGPAINRNSGSVISKSWHRSLDFLKKSNELGIFFNSVDLEGIDSVHLGRSFVFTFFIVR